MKKIFIGVFTLFTSLLMAQEEHLIGHWSMDGNVLDQSTLANDGSVSGNPTYVVGRNGGMDSAIVLDGTGDYITIPHFDEFNRDTLSISFWMRPDSKQLLDHGSFTYRIQSLFFKAPSTGVNDLTYSIYLRQNDLDTIVGLKSLMGSQRNTFDTNLDTILTGIDTWYHVSVVLEGTAHRMYINGELTDETTLSGNIQKNTSSIRIGNMANDSKRYFNGALDDYKIYNKALTVKEIKEEFTGQPVCVETIYETVTVYDTVKVTVEDTLVITLDKVLAASGNTILSDIKVFPNPTSDKVSFDFGDFNEFSGFSVKIMNNQGQEVFTEDINAQNTSTSLLGLGGKGLYIIHILDHNDEIVDVKKLVVK